MSSIAWWGYGIAFVVLVVILVGLYAMIRVMSDDSDKYEEIRALMDPLFHTPSFLRPGSDTGEKSAARDQTAASRTENEPFEEECPACRETVTHEHMECPSCGLRLLG